MLAWIPLLSLVLALAQGQHPELLHGARAEWRAVAAGPDVMSAEEIALSADAASGRTQAVILVEETDRTDDVAWVVRGRKGGKPSRLRYHLRAKVLSNEARGLADVEIPMWRKETSLEEWWGKTISPDGTVRQLSREDLLSQEIIRVENGAELRLLRGFLPGVEPGVVIDYGYELAGVPVQGYMEVPLQRPWPVRRLLYRWKPWEFSILAGLAGACSIYRSDDLDVKLNQAGGAFFLVASTLPPVIEEPYRPIGTPPGASVTLYYTLPAKNSDDFWDRIAGRVAQEDRSFLWRRHVNKMLKTMGVDRDGDPGGELRRAYEWIGRSMENLGMETAGDLTGHGDGSGEDEEEARDLLSRVLADRRATADQLDLMFLGAARALGFEAHTVLASDRRRHQWDPGNLAVGQFDERLVAVRLEGPDAGQLILFDAGSGLEFGSIPWWLSGSRALLVRPDGHEFIDLGGTGAAASVSETRVEMDFPSGLEGRTRVRWDAWGKGQVGLAERRELRRTDSPGRREMLEALCKSSSHVELLSAESPGLEERAGRYHLRCEAESDDVVRTWEAGAAQVRFDGPWIAEVPGFPDQDRVHPIEFPFPRTDVTMLEMRLPAGHAPGPLPDPVEIDSPFGSYTLRAEARQGKVSIRRSLRLPDRRLDADLAPGLDRFLDQVRSADRTPLIFVRREEGPP